MNDKIALEKGLKLHKISQKHIKITQNHAKVQRTMREFTKYRIYMLYSALREQNLA